MVICCPPDDIFDKILSAKNTKRRTDMKIKNQQLKRAKNKLIRKLRKQYNYKNASRTFDNKFISPYGGYIDIMNFANLVGLKKSIENHFILTDNQHRKYNDASLLQRLLDTVMLDIDRIDNADLFYNDPLLRYLEDLPSDPSPATLRRELKACNEDSLSSIESINTEFLRNCSSMQQKQTATLLIDQTPIPLYGNQEEAKKGFDHHTGDVCYQAVISSIKETNEVIKADLEPGNFKHSDEYFKEFFKRTMTMIPPHLTIDKVRMDSGFFSFPALDLLEEDGRMYFVKGRMYHTTPIYHMPHILPETDWIKVPDRDNLWISKKQEYFSSTYKKSYQVMFLRELIEDPDPKQGKLFNDKVYKYTCLYSNSTMDELSIWNFYNDGAMIESIIKELKNEFSLDKIPTSKFIANEAFLKIKILSYNILNAFKRMVLGGKWATKSAKTIRNWIIRIPVIVVSIGKGIRLSMAENIKLKQFVTDVSNEVFNIAASFVT